MKKCILTILISLLTIATFAQRGRHVPLGREEQLDQKYTSGLFSTVDGTYFDLVNDNNAIGANSYFNVLDWLQGRVAGLQVYTNRNIRIPYLRNQPAAIFVDEIRVDAGFLNMLPVHDIAMIKVIKSPFLGGWGAPGGAIAIYTKDGDEGEEVE
ncbi:hypothetical protein OCK74_02520 [Chitinophagaceae bacterium LB-8]|uniref:TonB-dependent receptor plug domain-containing protein n=1 Tax=Paraflavisolibacter caeni TaxID=2982496 RepID=A0A9X2XTA8_9BACT|nr:hypothetical protein [Paraflavisolibacter caeni]MCU7547966.1 hypothetical protein [Paraflavisolibacter caeni]